MYIAGGSYFPAACSGCGFLGARKSYGAARKRHCLYRCAHRNTQADRAAYARAYGKPDTDRQADKRTDEGSCTCGNCRSGHGSAEPTGNGHYHAADRNADADCNVCGVKREPPHNYVDEKDDTCDTCGQWREVILYIPGDANGDGKLNNRDLGLLQQYLNEWDVTISTDAADLNEDGKVNNRDLGLLQRLLNN